MSSQQRITIGGVEHTVRVIWRNLECGQVRSAYVTSDDPRGFTFAADRYPGNTAAAVAAMLVAEYPNLLALVAEVAAPLNGTEYPLARAMRVA